jgi:hypothetical protein
MLLVATWGPKSFAGCGLKTHPKKWKIIWKLHILSTSGWLYTYIHTECMILYVIHAKIENFS